MTGESVTTTLTGSEVVSAGPDESTAVTVKEYVPGAGVPASVPDVLSDRPGGKAPVSDQVTGVTPPLADNVALWRPRCAVRKGNRADSKRRGSATAAPSAADYQKTGDHRPEKANRYKSRHNPPLTFCYETASTPVIPAGLPNHTVKMTARSLKPTRAHPFSNKRVLERRNGHP